MRGKAEPAQQKTYGFIEWPKVVVLEEKFPFDKTEHARWLYTACPRAADKLVLIQQ